MCSLFGAIVTCIIRNSYCNDLLSQLSRLALLNIIVSRFEKRDHFVLVIFERTLDFKRLLRSHTW